MSKKHPLDNMWNWSSLEARTLFQKHYDILSRQGWYPSSIIIMFKELLLAGGMEVLASERTAQVLAAEERKADED